MMSRTLSLFRKRKIGFGRGVDSSSGNVVGEIENPNDSAPTGVFLGGERRNDSPPADDVCAICFGDFTIPCKTNCGHWFCGNCVLQFWSYKASLQKCKCPMCSGLISKLTPEACLSSRQEKEVIEVLKNVRMYNNLFQGGVLGLLQNVLAFPLLIKRMFQGLMDPDRFNANYTTARCVGLLLGVMYQLSPFDFIPGGFYVTYRLFEVCATGLVVILCLVGICRRAVLIWRMRSLAASLTRTDL